MRRAILKLVITIDLVRWHTYTHPPFKCFEKKVFQFCLSRIAWNYGTIINGTGLITHLNALFLLMSKIHTVFDVGTLF